MIERSKIIEKDDSEYGKEYVLLSDVRTYGDQRAAEAREQMREECAKLIGKPVWLTWDVRAALITLIRKLS